MECTRARAQHGELCTGGTIRFKGGRVKPSQHDRIVGRKRHDTPQELRATSGAREADGEPVGEAEIGGPDELAGHEGAVGWFRRGAEESA